jgi:hypothetical protein
VNTGTDTPEPVVVATSEEAAWLVEYTVRGAYRISTRGFDNQAEAEAFAARWRRSNSTGHYVATVLAPGLEPRRTPDTISRGASTRQATA